MTDEQTPQPTAEPDQQQSEHVRVREGGWEYTIRRDLLPEDLESSGLTVLKDKDPYGPNGRPADPKPVTPLGTAAPGSTKARTTSGATGSGAASEKEN